MQIQKDGSILIDAPSKGVGRSYMDGNHNVQCLDLYSVDGVVLANGQLASNGLDTASYAAKTFTANATDDYITVSLQVYTKLQAVTVSSSGTLPGGLTAGTTYYVCGISGNTLKLADSIANAIIDAGHDITTAGTGTHTITATQMGKVKKIIQDSSVTTTNYRYYAIDDNGRVWVNYGNVPWVHLPGNATGAGQGIQIWKGYLFAFGDGGKVSTYGPLSSVGSGASWTSSWQDVTDSDAYYAPSVVGQDDILYFAFGRHVYSVEEAAGSTFAPGTSASYSFLNPCLTIPSGYRIKTMVELGSMLAIGTWKGSDTTVYSFEDKTADIFFWDRSSTSFDLPIKIEENGVNQMLAIGNTLFAVCGHEGRIYATNTTSSTLFATIPPSMVNKQQSSDHLWFFPNAIMQHKGRIFIGVGAVSGTSLYPLGVYSIDPSTGRVCVENVVSTGADGAGGYVQIGALLSSGEDDYYCGIYNDSAQTYKGRIDKTNGIRYYSDEAFFETGIASVGAQNRKKSYTKMDISLARPLASNQSLKIWYRTAINGSYTLLGSYDYTTYGAFQDLNVSVPIISVTALQFKVALNGNSSTTPELKYIIVSE